MRLLAGLITGITLSILWHTLGWPLIGWLFTRNLPATPHDWQPKHRTWINGVEEQ